MDIEHGKILLSGASILISLLFMLVVFLMKRDLDTISDKLKDFQDFQDEEVVGANSREIRITTLEKGKTDIENLLNKLDASISKQYDVSVQIQVSLGKLQQYIETSTNEWDRIRDMVQSHERMIAALQSERGN
jgi:hypothetical protein